MEIILKLVRAFLGKKISLETLVVFEKLLHYRKRFNKEIKEQIHLAKGKSIN